MQVLETPDVQVKINTGWTIVSGPVLDGLMLVTIINTGYPEGSECTKALIVGLKNRKPHKRVRGVQATIWGAYPATERHRWVGPATENDWSSDVDFGHVAHGEAVQMFVQVKGDKPGHFCILMRGLSV